MNNHLLANTDLDQTFVKGFYSISPCFTMQVESRLAMCRYCLHLDTCQRSFEGQGNVWMKHLPSKQQQNMSYGLKISALLLTFNNVQHINCYICFEIGYNI